MKVTVLDGGRRTGRHRVPLSLLAEGDATTARGERFPLADGGSLDWMARLLGDGKERMIASGFGPDLVASLFRP